MHEDFSWWLEEESCRGSEVALSLERANAAIMPTARVAGRPAPTGCDAGEQAHLRWVRPEDEQPLMAALARLHAAGELDLGEGSRYVGSFRAHGLAGAGVGPRPGRAPQRVGRAGAGVRDRLAEALADDEPLTDAERRARDGILGRQVTLR